MQGDLKPTRPEYAKEPNIGDQVTAVCNRVVCCKGCEVGDEKQIEEEFDGICFVPLGEDEVLVIGTS